MTYALIYVENELSTSVGGGNSLYSSAKEQQIRIIIHNQHQPMYVYDPKPLISTEM